MDCGPTCLKMIAKHYGRGHSLENLRRYAGISKEGVSLLGISQAAEKIGLHAFGTQLSFEQLAEQVPLPCIVHWQQRHFVVVYDIKPGKGSRGATVYVADPEVGLVRYSEAEFMAGWGVAQARQAPTGLALLLEPTPGFWDLANEPTDHRDLSHVFRYLFQYKKLLVQLGLGLLIGGVLQFILPFLAQSVVDVGIGTRNLRFIYLVLLAQFVLFAGRMATEFLRNWLLLHISTRVNVAIISDYFIKLMKLPLAFFEAKMYGDLMRRINDHDRIEKFLTDASVNTLFSALSLVVYCVVLGLYSTTILLVFAGGSILYVLWVLLFMRFRRLLDHRRFQLQAQEQSTVLEIITGMQEIKLGGAALKKRWAWEALQARLFRLNTHTMRYNQYQQAGASFINEGKNILITCLAAVSVLEGRLSLGELVAVQYIAGQLNGPIEQLINFLRALQDAQISFERLSEVHNLEDEDPVHELRLQHIPPNHSFSLRDVSFHYPGALLPVLSHLNLQIPAGKTTAIVGMSGSGKTTLLRLLLKFYEPTTGALELGEANLRHLSHEVWRSQCGVVMQDGFIFSDTIAQNIAFGQDEVDLAKLYRAIRVANLHDFVESLPLGAQTKIGAEGNGVSQGQRQRILIARAVYKNPDFLFFDEATNALDANNESVIMANLEEFFQGRTVVVVAHRLSTVMSAHQIVVLDKGGVAEVGTHAELVRRQGFYYTLVKNQLALGS
jgi:ATP-binding cassette subfamily B protein